MTAVVTRRRRLGRNAARCVTIKIKTLSISTHNERTNCTKLC
jgi:hypothetical protein